MWVVVESVDNVDKFFGNNYFKLSSMSKNLEKSGVLRFV